MKRPKKPKLLSRYERVVPMTEPLPVDTVLQLFRVLVDKMDFEIVVEETPSYVAYALRPKHEEPF